MLTAYKEIIHGANTIDTLAVKLHKSTNRSSEIISELVKNGFIVRKQEYHQQASRFVIEISGTNYSLRLKELIIKYQSIKFENILAGSKLLFLAALSEDWISLREALRLSRISKHTVNRYIHSFLHRGLIQKQHGLYALNQKMWSVLRQFILDYKNYDIVNGHIHWRYQGEMIFEVDREGKVQGEISGLARYQDYGVLVRVISALCYTPQKRLSKEEIFVHSLFEIDDPRTLHLAATFYVKNRLKYYKVLPVAMKYGKYTMFQSFMKKFASGLDLLKLDLLPPFDRKDFKRIAHMYGVKNV
jgi:predicted transcriptional regulator